MPDRDKFAILKKPQRIWAVASIHGEARRLDLLHRHLAERLSYGDRLVYLGNYLGHGTAVRETLDVLIDFRRRLIAQPGVFVFDVAYLRGAQEEMWQKLLQLQFAPNPREVVAWMLDQGVGATLEAYGGVPQQTPTIARSGALAITRWTSSLRAAMQAAHGHYQLMSTLRRAAFSDDGKLLFVHAGIDPTRPLTAQSDSFWWGIGGFARIREPYAGFVRVIRGYDRGHGGVEHGPFTTTLDAGCGFGGPLVAGCFDLDGKLVDRIEV